MNDLEPTTRRRATFAAIRPAAWALVISMGVAAVITWRVLLWTPPSTLAQEGAEERLGAVDRERPGVATYDVQDRLPAPPLEGRTIEGDYFELAELRGDIVVINVWGSWCGPCRAETPGLVRLARESAGRGVRFVGINTRDNAVAARAFVRKFGVHYPSVDDTDGRALLGFRRIIPTAVIPSTVLVDRDGQVAARVIGPVTYRTLKALLIDEIGPGSPW